MSHRVLLSWSSGKDSAWTLHMLRKDPDVEVVGLLTTVNTTHGRVAMHHEPTGPLARPSTSLVKYVRPVTPRERRHKMSGLP
jgi:diphthamide synthase (EF-2-diphthine--ammonia ligase)